MNITRRKFIKGILVIGGVAIIPEHAIAAAEKLTPVKIWGQKTLSVAHVTKTNMLWIKRKIESHLSEYVFEFNDDLLRTQIRGHLGTFLEQCKSEQMIYDYNVVCDETNNIPYDVDRGVLSADVFLRPVRMVDITELKFKVA